MSKHFKVDNYGENREVLLTTTVHIPYKGNKDELPRRNYAALLADAIGQFSPLLIKALEARIEACSNNLIHHLDNVICNDGFQIIYQRKDKSIHSFNVPSMKAMFEAIGYLKAGQWRCLCTNPLCIDQTLKALFWAERPEDKSGAIKYSELISLLMELHANPFDSQK